VSFASLVFINDSTAESNTESLFASVGICCWRSGGLLDMKCSISDAVRRLGGCAA